MSDIITSFQMHLPALIPTVPLLFAFLMPLIGKKSKSVALYTLVTVVFIDLLLVIWLSYLIFSGNPSIAVYSFGQHHDPRITVLRTPSGMIVPIRILFEIDAMGALMMMIISIIAFVATIYSISFMRKDTGIEKYSTLVLLMLAATLGLVMTGDMFNFFVWFEILSIASCALIAFRTDMWEGGEGAFKYMVVSTVGGLFLLFAIGLFYTEYGTLNMAMIAHYISTSGITMANMIGLSILIGILAMKAGTVPMHMWKPDAYTAAPAPISIMLVVGAQASLYALLRVVFTIYGALLNTLVIGTLIAVLGTITIFVGVSMALIQRDIKRLIAYAAVAEIGYMLLAVGVGLAHLNGSDMISWDNPGYRALTGGIFHILNDALDISLLFLVAGAIYYVRGTRDLNALGGLARKMDTTTLFFIIGLAAASGLPPLNGFASKIIIYESVYAFNPVLAIIALLGSIMMLAIFVKVLHSVFLGPPLPENKNVSEVPRPMLLAMCILTVLIIFIGMFPDIILHNIAEPSARALIERSEYISRILGP